MTHLWRELAFQSPRGHKHEKNPTKTSSPYVSKYEGRSNGGIPCFSQERSQERSLKVSETRKRAPLANSVSLR